MARLLSDEQIIQAVNKGWEDEVLSEVGDIEPSDRAFIKAQLGLYGRRRGRGWGSG